MSIRFSEITLSDPSGLVAQGLIKGHPDKDDLRGDESLREVADKFDYPIQVSVQRYCYLTDSDDEEDADCDHLALISAYDELADLCNSLNPSHSVGTFTNRDDVAHLDYFEFQVEALDDEF